MNSTRVDRDASVTIRRLEAIYTVPHGHPSPEALRARMDALARQELAASCRRILTGALDPRDPSIWFVRRMEIGLTIDAGALDSDRLANAWAAKLTKSVVETFARGADADSVIYFPNRAAYLAEFAADLAEGRAWDKWYYEDSLRSLPAGQAIVEALVREPEHMAATLRGLVANGSLEKVLDSLGESGARMVYEACFQTSPSSLTERQAAEAALAAWGTAFSASPELRGGGSLKALRLLAATLQSAPEIGPSHELRMAIDHLIAFAELLSKVPDPEMVALKLAAGNFEETAAMARAVGAGYAAGSMRFVERLARNDVGWMSKVVDTIGQGASATTHGSGQTSGGGKSFVTSFGSVFLLLPCLLEQGVQEIISSSIYSGLPEADLQPLVRLILLIKLFGAGQVLAAQNDPALWLAAGWDKPAPQESLTSLCELGTEEVNQECLRLLTELLLQKGYATGRHLSLDCVTTNGLGMVLLIRDVESDMWLWALPCQGNDLKVRTLLRQALEYLATLYRSPDGLLLIGPGASGFLDSETIYAIRRHTVWLEPGGNAGTEPVPLGSGSRKTTVWVKESFPSLRQEPNHLSSLLQARPAPENDLNYLSPASSGSAQHAAILPNVAFDLVWSLAARIVLRAFACKLLGFGQSSLPYLRENFLSGTSSICVQDKSIYVELPACPLRVVLTMAGTNGQTYSVPWLDNAQVTLFLPAN